MLCCNFNVVNYIHTHGAGCAVLVGCVRDIGVVTFLKPYGDIWCISNRGMLSRFNVMVRLVRSTHQWGREGCIGVERPQHRTTMMDVIKRD